MTIGDAIFNFNEARCDYEAARKELLQKAMDEGADEKALNGDHRCTLWFLRGRQGRGR